jgi:hypothetical protein
MKTQRVLLTAVLVLVASRSWANPMDDLKAKLRPKSSPKSSPAAPGTGAPAGAPPSSSSSGAGAASSGAPSATHRRPAKDPKREMLGFQLGMSLEEAQAVAAAAGAKLESKEVYTCRGSKSCPKLLIEATVSMPNGQEITNISLGFSPPPLPIQVVHIRRTTGYQKGGTTVDNIKGALQTKFGAPGLSRANYSEWAWGSEGSSAEVPAHPPTCDSPPVIGYKGGIDTSGMATWIKARSSSDWNTCATASFSANAEGVVTSYGVDLFDVAYETQALGRIVDDASSAADAKKKEDLQQASEQKPTL